MLANRNLDAVTSQSAFFSSVTEFLQTLAATRPTVVVLEDVHWSDPASLELLRYVSIRVATLPLLLVVTYREDELTRQNPFYQQLPSLVRESEGLRLDLRRLSTHDLNALVALHYAMSDEDRARLVDYLAAHADGNPFFALELLRTLEVPPDAGLIRMGDTWVLAELERMVVPPLVRQVIDSRVARLGEPASIVLTISAVIGHEISLDLLASIADMPADVLYTIVDQAMEWHLLMATPDGTDVQFVHALTREALYTSTPPHRRRALHKAVAEALVALPRQDIDAIAYHYEQAGDSRAPEWLTKAGDRAQRAYAWLTAKDRFATAARLLEDIPGEEQTRARLLYRCGRLQRYSSADTAIESLRTAAQLAEIAGDQVLAADATYSQGLVQCFADAWQPGLADMIRGVETLEALPPDKACISWATANWMADALPMLDQPAAHIDVSGNNLTAIGPIRHRSLPWFLAAGGRIRESLTLAESYQDLLSETEMGPLALANAGHSQFGRGTALAALGHPDEARSGFDQARHIYRQLDHHAVLAFVDITELIDVLVPYRTQDVAGRYRLAGDAEIAIDHAHGALAAEVSPLRAQLITMYLDGRWNEARHIAYECRVHGTYVLRRPVTHTLAPIAMHQGDTDEAWRQVLALLPQGPDTEAGTAVLLDALMLQRLAIRMCLDAGDVAGADRWLEGNDRWLSWSGSVLGQAENHLAWAERHHAAGDTSPACKRAEGAIAGATSPSQPLVLLRARRLKGTLAHELSDMKVAEEELTSSLLLATACQIPFERAQSLLALARLNATTNQVRALEMSDEALVICRTLGARPLGTRTQHFIEGINAACAEGEMPGGLTTRELDVVRLVAQGMTDAEVGGTLSISSRTVSQHLRSVYSKLNVRSRLEATRFLIDHHLV